MASDSGDLIILDGCTFFYADHVGDVEARGPSGLFYRDVRHLSEWKVLIDGKELEQLTSKRVDYFSARVVGAPASKGKDAPPVSVRRDRFVSEGAHEDVVIENLSDEPRTVRLEVVYGSDFADVMEAQNGGNSEGKSWVDLSARSATLWNEREDYRRGTVLTFSRQGRVLKKCAHFSVELAPRETWSLCIDITPIVDGERKPPLLRCDSFHQHAKKMPVSLDEWMETAPSLVTERSSLERIYRQSLLDLAALRVRPDTLTIKYAMPGGGLPWFMTVFGRDSIITAYEAMPFQAELAQATLAALAELQSTEWDSWRDAEPGKIQHELRRGTLAALRRIPHSPYYGSHDATPLWLILLDEYERWSGDAAFVRKLEPNARAALAWLEGPADFDGDGYVEYRKRSDSKHALDNHCWKDSKSSIVFADGHLAEPPIAVCEHQGYAYDARLRTARLLREVWNDPDEAVRLEEAAADLKRRFNKDYWSPSRRHYVLALDGEKNQVDAMTSNVGHLLWSGIVDERRAGAMVKRLMRPDLFSGWGIRTLSTENPSYNPLEYHNGTVWPHDTGLIAAGLARYGYREEASRLAVATLEAATHFDYRLPEVFVGYARHATPLPVAYPTACSPQAWATGTPLLLLRVLLGLEPTPDALLSKPTLADPINTLVLHGVPGRWAA